MPETNWLERYNAAMINTMRIRLNDVPGALASVLNAIGSVRTPVGDIRTIDADSTHKIRDVQVFCVDREHLTRTINSVSALDVAEVLVVTDDVLEIHRRGPIKTVATVPLDTVMDLRMVYTPGVASVCSLIHEKPEAAWTYTGICDRIAIVTNGTAVLGLGDIGPLASLPVMEGKAAILAKFVGISAEPFLIESKDSEEIINIVAKCAGSYGAIQLEDIGAPACFEIEQRLQEILDIPVFHDDQHGTATVCIAGLINALKQTHRSPGDCQAVVLGAGAAGLAIAQFLVDFGIGDVILCDSRGAIFEGRADGMNPWKDKLAAVTNRNRVQGTLADCMKGRNLFIGVSRPNMVTQDMVRSMGRDPIVFALANPVSEIRAGDALAAGAAIAVDGRGMNNALAYPGIFRGALNAKAKHITHAMKLAAAEALAGAVEGGALLPDMFDPGVHARVAHAVAEAAR